MVWFLLPGLGAFFVNNCRLQQRLFGQLNPLTNTDARLVVVLLLRAVGLDLDQESLGRVVRRRNCSLHRAICKDHCNILRKCAVFIKNAAVQKIGVLLRLV